MEHAARIEPAGRKLRRVSEEGVAVAFAGQNEGEFQFFEGNGY
ncbi:MAG: hypothetical protein NTU45_00140 [Planctomycetota bacterium]|nr:hypothetical protein [Planctomycetota bacterium]